MRTTGFLWMCALACLLALACGGSTARDTDVPRDVPADVAGDGTPDAPPDAADDSARDVPGDTAKDLVADAPDLPVDTPADDARPADGTIADTPPDAPTDAPVDAPSDLPTDLPPPAPWWESLSPSGPATRERIGVSSHMHGGTGSNAERDFEIARYQELGAVHVRNDFIWDWIEPVQDQWNFEPVTGEVDAVGAAGGDMLAIINYGVAWAETNAGGTSSIDPALYGAYAGGLAAHLCDHVKRYEVWNEPNLKNFWSPEPDPAHYGAFLAAAYDAVKAACPDATVVLGGQAATDSSLGWAFLKDLGTVMPDVCDSFDVLAIHPYTFIQLWSPERDFRSEDGYAYPGQSAMTQYARDRLADWGCPDRPVWFTEMGWPSYEVSETDQGRWLARSLLLSARDDVDRYYWYTFWDGEAITTGTRPHENYFGLFGPPGPPPEKRRAKPAWFALLGLSKTVGDARYAGDLSAGLGLPNDVYALAFLHADGVVDLAMWDGRDEPDDGPDGEDPGGPDTTLALNLPLPPGASVEVRDLNGEVVRPAVLPAGPVGLTLTPSVQYVRVDLP